LLQLELAALLDVDDLFVWQAAAFEPVAGELESVLERLGLLRNRVALAA